MAGSAGSGALQEWRAHWRVLIPCFVGIMLCSTHGAVIGVMILPIEQELGWPRAQITGGFLIISIIALLVSPIAGRAVDRLGPRRIGLFGILFYCSALALLSTTTSDVASWWALWGLLAVAMMTVMPAVWLAVINGYFVRSRGLAMAIALSATGMGAAVFPIIANTLVEAVGWRNAYVALGAIVAAVAFPLALFLFHPARQLTMLAERDQGQSSEPRVSPKAQITSARFVKLAGAAVIFAVGSSALTTNAVPVLVGEGLGPATAAAIVGLIGIGSVTGRLLGGYLLDRFNGNIVAAVSALLPIVPTAIFLGTDGSVTWAVFACLVMGLSVGTEVDCCAYLAARHFGTENFGTLFGTINGVLLFGNGLAPILANYGYDMMQTYDVVLMLLIPFYLGASLLFATLGRYPDLEEDGTLVPSHS